jgi:prepilin-type N-terminal cleavage/methylation domain-containing protein
MVIVKDNTGFTLVEVMVALVIFLVASIGLMSVLLTHMQVNRDLGLHAKARRLAGEAMAELQVVDYGHLGTLARVPLCKDEIEIQRSIDANGLPDDQSRITVVARWPHRGRLHRYQLQTVRSVP